MKLQYRKIRNIEKNVCTCEQKIAYNLAYDNYLLFIEKYKAQVTEVFKMEIVSEFISCCMESYKKIASNKYNIDAIFCALNAGARDYLESGRHLLTTYEEVGKMFPACYL